MIEPSAFGELTIREDDLKDAPPVSFDAAAISDGLPEKWERLQRLNPKARDVWEADYKDLTNCQLLERKGRKESVAQVPGFFADLDFDRFDAGGIEALERLDGFTPPPQQKADP